MSRYSKAKWDEMLQKYVNSGAMERRGLKYIHDPCSLKELSSVLASHLEYSGINASVKVGSIWIDGTPQAKAKVLGNAESEIQCELADLLILLNVGINGALDRRSAVLIQGKIGTNPTKIPPGNSTNKERSLLERFDDSHPLEIYKDTQGKSLLNSSSKYNIKTGLTGFKKYARYLVMPTTLDSPIVQKLGPFVTGWATRKRSFDLEDIDLFTLIPISLWEGKVGTALLNQSNDEWTRLVEDIAGHYATKKMKRFGGFDRYVDSTMHLSFCRNGAFSSTERFMHDRSHLDMDINLGSDFDESIPPRISIIRFDVNVIKIEQESH
ncbi:hypothetical protein [Serratia marcescens]|uniref:hypothetical protein n=1 Tax=Serratia marcescens TaxID=615 RepID=UPI0024683654|nr:hypothetical protein [Serratia marcescens]WGL90816.1 hypothetical protein QFB85_20890 [Serratia marcescens]